MSATVKSAQAIHSRPSRRRSTSPSQRWASFCVSALTFWAALSLSNISMISRHTRVVSTVPTAAKHHWTTHRPPLSGAEAAALAAWCERAHDGESLGEVARELLSLPVVLRAAAALAALRTSLAVNDPDPEWQTPQRVARLLADYIERPGPDLADLESATGAVESNWNAVAGDSGHPEPTYQAATYAGWTVTCPDDPFNMVHALTGAAKAVGERRVLDAVREALLPFLHTRDA